MFLPENIIYLYYCEWTYLWIFI